jgi:hypothetical protein
MGHGRRFRGSISAVADPSPLNVFGRTADAAAVAGLVHERLKGSKIHSHGTEFSIVFTPRRQLFKPPDRGISVNVGLQYFAGSGGERQRAGMANFIGTKFVGGGMANVLSAIPQLRLAVAFMATDPIRPELTDGLFRLAVDVAAASGGFVMDIGRGQIWGQGGEQLGVLASDSEAPPALSDDRRADEGDEERNPPDPARVRKRLIVLFAIAARGSAEAGAHDRPGARAQILRWVEQLQVDDELEPKERAILLANPGEISDRDVTNSSWRLEGAATLGWALGLSHLSTVDTVSEPGDLVRVLGFPAADRTAQLLAHSSLRSPAELSALSGKLFSIHWRLRQFRLEPKRIDFAEFARTAWFGPLNIDGVDLVERDLALGGLPIWTAPAELVWRAQSVASERHLAINWLHEGGIYSEIDNST